MGPWGLIENLVLPIWQLEFQSNLTAQKGRGGGAVDTNDWCITGRTILSLPGDSITYLISFKTRRCFTFELADAVRAITDRDGTNALSSPTSENSGLNATSPPFCRPLANMNLGTT